MTGGAALRPDRRQMLLAGALVAAAGAAAVLRPERVTGDARDGALEASVPRTIGSYRFASSTGLVVPAEGEISDRIYDQLLTRIYVANGVAPLMLLIAWGNAQDAALGVHRPEVCYPAAGFTIEAAGNADIAGVAGGRGGARFVTAAGRGEPEQVYYWIRIGDRFPTTPLAQKVDMFAENLRGRLPDGVLVRLSVRSADRAAALAQLAAFNRLLLGAVDSAGRRMLLGDA